MFPVLQAAICWSLFLSVFLCFLCLFRGFFVGFVFFLFRSSNLYHQLLSFGEEGWIGMGVFGRNFIVTRLALLYDNKNNNNNNNNNLALNFSQS